MSWIADELVSSWGEGASWTQDPAVHPHEAHYLKLDTSKARQDLGWRPLLPLKSGLQWIVEWYRALEAGDDIQRLTRSQIERYETVSSRGDRFGVDRSLADSLEVMNKMSRRAVAPSKRFRRSL